MSFLLIHYFDLSFIKTRYTFKLTILFGGFLSICLPDKLILTTWENVTRPIQQSHLRKRLAAVLTEPLSGKVQAKIPFSFLQATSERTNTTKIGLTFAWTVFGNKFSVFQLILIYKLRSTTFSAVKLVERHSRTLTAVAGWKQNSDKTASLANVSSFRKKTSYITRVVIGKRTCFIRVQNTEMSKALAPSPNFYYVRPYSGLHSCFFSLIGREISEQASR